MDAADANGNNASHYACRAGESGALALLADAGASLDTPSRTVPSNAAGKKCASGMCPVHLAVVHGSLSCLELLAARGVNLEVTDGDGETPLSLAVKVRVALLYVCILWIAFAFVNFHQSGTHAFIQRLLQWSLDFDARFISAFGLAKRAFLRCLVAFTEQTFFGIAFYAATV